MPGRHHTETHNNRKTSMPSPEETIVRVQVQGTTVMAVYEVHGDAVMLASADFGDAQAPLDGTPPDQVAAALLRNLAETAMARNEDQYMHDDGSPHPKA
jgi:CelD/BcsL family acetyltransferase involved in cellulose biosynthesis